MERQETTYRKYLLITLTAMVLLLAAIVSLVYVADPYQQFRPSDRYINNARMEIPGVSRHHDYNAALMGSSMAMNNDHHLVDSLFSKPGEPWKTRNFTLIGGMSDDFDVILPRLRKDGKVRHIIFDLDFFSFGRKQNTIQPFLYSDNYFDKLKYIFNYTTLKDCYTKYSMHWVEDSIYHFNNANSKEILVENYKKAIAQPLKMEGYDFSFEHLKEAFEHDLMAHVEAMKEVDWYIYFPPYSAFEFVRYKDEGNWPDIFRFKTYVCQRLLSCENVRLYDFQTDDSYVMALSEYMDIRHFTHAFNDRIITEISENKGRLSRDNYQEKIDLLNRKVLVLDADSLMKQ